MLSGVCERLCPASVSAWRRRQCGKGGTSILSAERLRGLCAVAHGASGTPECATASWLGNERLMKAQQGMRQA